MSPGTDVYMSATAMAHHLPLPAGVDRQTGSLLTLAECLAEPGRMEPFTSLSIKHQIALVTARWLAGEWRNVSVMPGGFINRDRAIREIAAQNELGRNLLQVGMLAVQLVHRHSRPSGGTV